MLLFLFGLNIVLIMFCIQCIAAEYVARFCTVFCLYNVLDSVINIFNYRYFHTDVLPTLFKNKNVGKIFRKTSKTRFYKKKNLKTFITTVLEASCLSVILRTVSVFTAACSRRSGSTAGPALLGTGTRRSSRSRSRYPGLRRIARFPVRHRRDQRRD